jgi:hypothetical protein
MHRQASCSIRAGRLGGVDEFEPVSGFCEMNHSKESVGELVISGGDGAVDLQMSEHPLDAVALPVEQPVMVDFHASVRSAGDDGSNLPGGKIGTDGVRIIAFVREQGVGCPVGQIDQGAIRLAVRSFTGGQVEGERSSEGISQSVKLTAEPAPRATKSASMSPPFPPAADTSARTVVLSML